MDWFREHSPQVAKVLIDGPKEMVCDYGIPETLTSQIKIGARVWVSLRDRKVSGTVLLIENQSEESTFNVKPIDALIDKSTVIPENLMQLGRWMADYYLAPMEQVMRALLPHVVRADKNQAKLQQQVRWQWGAIDKFTLEQKDAWEKLEKRSPKQYILVNLILQTDKPFLVTELLKLSGASRATLKGLETKGMISIEQVAIRRDPEAQVETIESAPKELNEQQLNAVTLIKQSIDESANARVQPILLQGVTGSGKTEVYLQSAAHVLAQGESTLILVPEIALTPQTVGRFKSRFLSILGNLEEVAVLHSGLSDGERFDEWHRIERGQARVVIGARSAIFAPIQNLGLIVVDEEHEGSYKQESSPRYQARDVAVMRGYMEQCPVVLGSATPSLESIANVQAGKYQIIELTKRIDGSYLPLIQLVDMRLEASKIKGEAMIAEPLRIAIDERLEKQEQIILFLNRRGFSKAVMCTSCGEKVNCAHCSISMTYYRTDDMLRCHCCGYQSLVPKICSECGERASVYHGFGTERVEEALRKIFPTARIARLDTNVTQRKHALRDTLDAFRTRKLDILLGTQMIAKGLDFPGVTLVGILNADVSLHMPDFRSSERTFQLLTQVAGRAGRGDLAGEVMIQTYMPHHPAIQYARHHDVHAFAAQELQARKMFKYPPYLHLALVHVSSLKQEHGQLLSEHIHKALEAKLPQGVWMGQPHIPLMSKIDNRYRYQIMIRTNKISQIQTWLSQTLSRFDTGQESRIVIDIDPYNLI